ncbi:MAG: bifunctional tetrahydrofolate synthase/dihydrofolate synthase, partial [Psychrosphaera sp.]|nr:bifunctional tetrahydrofolate synthase/dihydrofolate synthase [Psychrosphaera sp.]
MTEQIKSQSSKALPKGLDDWLYHLNHLHNKDIDLGLDRIGKVAQTLGLNDSSAKIILLAGTNGKGTTSRFLEAYLIQLGFAVGVFNSPQLLHYNERVRINAQVLADDVHVKAFAHIEAHRGDTSLTEFEFSTLAALQIFDERALDFVIMEVGMGGREDSTNIVNPSISVSTT